MARLGRAGQSRVSEGSSRNLQPDIDPDQLSDAKKSSTAPRPASGMAGPYLSGSACSVRSRTLTCAGEVSRTMRRASGSGGSASGSARTCRRRSHHAPDCSSRMPRTSASFSATSTAPRVSSSHCTGSSCRSAAHGSTRERPASATAAYRAPAPSRPGRDMVMSPQRQNFVQPPAEPPADRCTRTRGDGRSRACIDRQYHAESRRKSGRTRPEPPICSAT
jgi:hypothetical protein